MEPVLPFPQHAPHNPSSPGQGLPKGSIGQLPLAHQITPDRAATAAAMDLINNPGNEPPEVILEACRVALNDDIDCTSRKLVLDAHVKALANLPARRS